MSRDPQRIDEILTWLRGEWEKDPDIRLGQLLHNNSWGQIKDLHDLFYIEDSVWLRKARGDERSS
jgi:uncharacterized protein YihD (DUF1040 family)